MNKRSLIQTIIAGVIIVAAVALWQNRRKLSGAQDYYAYYEDIQGLQPSSPVQINGVRVGKILDIDLNGGGRVKVKISVNKDVVVTEGTTAYLMAGGLTGEKIIRLDIARTGRRLPQEAVIPTALDTSVMDVSVQITPMLETGKMILKSSDSTLQAFSAFLGSGLLSSTTHRIITIEANTKGLARLSATIDRKGCAILDKINRLDSSTARMAADNPNRTASISDMQQQTAKLKNQNTREQVNSIKTNVAKISASFKGINNNKILNDRQAYISTTNELDTLNQSLRQTYEAPAGFTLFGGKKKK